MSTDKPTITLLISCPDQPGIVAAISSFIFEHGGNILESDQHSTNEQECTFFMRVSFGEATFRLRESELIAAFTPIAEHFH
ncbi:MAG TPA: ACT domain-containing protein, partial [Ktedonobacteraceae bacterium]